METREITIRIANPYGALAFFFSLFFGGIALMTWIVVEKPGASPEVLRAQVIPNHPGNVQRFAPPRADTPQRPSYLEQSRTIYASTVVNPRTQTFEAQGR